VGSSQFTREVVRTGSYLARAATEGGREGAREGAHFMPRSARLCARFCSNCW
jgi:hypothetical protein